MGFATESATRIPFDSCGKAQNVRRFRIVLTSDEVRRLIEALPLRERTLVLMAAGTGLRMSELFALKWGDVHFDRA